MKSLEERKAERAKRYEIEARYNAPEPMPEAIEAAAIKAAKASTKDKTKSSNTWNK